MAIFYCIFRFLLVVIDAFFVSSFLVLMRFYWEVHKFQLFFRKRPASKVGLQSRGETNLLQKILVKSLINLGVCTRLYSKNEMCIKCK